MVMWVFLKGILLIILVFLKGWCSKKKNKERGEYIQSGCCEAEREFLHGRKKAHKAKKNLILTPSN